MQISATQGIRDEIAARLNEIESDNTDIYTNWINLGLRDIAYSFPAAPFLQTSATFTLSSGQRVYTNIATSAEKINDITIPAYQVKVQYVSPEEFDILTPSASQTGTPYIYTIRGLAGNGTFEFYYVPAATVTAFIDYEKAITAVSAAADVPGIPSKYFELLIAYGEKLGLRRQKRYDMAILVDKEYQGMKQRMMEDLMRQTTQMPRIKNARDFTYRQNPNTTDPISQAFFGGGGM